MSRFFKFAAVTMLAAASFVSADGRFEAFTGKVIGKKVRLRTAADLESFVVRELGKSDLLVVTGERGDFYEVQPPSEMKAYVFRSFILDNVVEGNRVNVRLAPDLEAPVISHLNTGTRIDGSICTQNNKWLEIDPPATTKFFIAKEFIEFAGAPDLKETFDRRKSAVEQLMESSSLLSQAEICKPFVEIDRDRVVSSFQHIIDNYSDFEDHVEKARDGMSAFTENYLQKKISYLEKKTAQMGKDSILEESYTLDGIAKSSPTDRMKAWEHVEESLFLSWSAMHHAKTMDDFYSDQRLSSLTISGILEGYPDPIKNKPGDFVLKEKDLPVAYVYSTHVNLHNLVGKRVNLSVTPRPNNSFAFPAYFVLDAN